MTEDLLIAFLRARWDEEEQMACTHQSGIANAWAPRTIEDIKAKRRILDEYADALRIRDGFRETGYEEGRREALEMACQSLTLPYASHPAYRREWAP